MKLKKTRVFEFNAFTKVPPQTHSELIDLIWMFQIEREIRRTGRGDDDDKDRTEWDREKRFLLNLTRMIQETEAVFPEHFIELITYLTKENVSELAFLESAYTSVLLNDPELAVPFCDMEQFIKKVEKAKKEENENFLLVVKKAHGKARLVLDQPGVKEKIKMIIEDRETASHRKTLCQGLSWMLQYLEHFGTSPDSSIFERTITDVVNNQHFQLLMAPGDKMK